MNDMSSSDETIQPKPRGLSRRTLLRVFGSAAAHGVSGRQEPSTTPTPPPIDPEILAAAQRQRLADAQVAFNSYAIALKEYGHQISKLPACPYGFGIEHTNFPDGTSEKRLKESYDTLEAARLKTLDAFSSAGRIPKKNLSWEELKMNIDEFQNPQWCHSPIHQIVEFTGIEIKEDPKNIPADSDLYAQQVAALHKHAIKFAKAWDAINRSLESLAVQASTISGVKLGTMHAVVKKMRDDLLREEIGKDIKERGDRLPRHENLRNFRPFQTLVPRIREEVPNKIEKWVNEVIREKKREKEELTQAIPKMESQRYTYGEGYIAETKKRLEDLVVPSPISASQLRGLEAVAKALGLLAILGVAKAIADAPPVSEYSDKRHTAGIGKAETARIEFQSTETLDLGNVLNPAAEPATVRKLKDSTPPDQSSSKDLRR